MNNQIDRSNHVHALGATTSMTITANSIMAGTISADRICSSAYDLPIHTIEKDNKMIHLFEATGFDESTVTTEEEFINKSKSFYVCIQGEYKDVYSSWENNLNVRMLIDSSTYNGYSIYFHNGLLILELHEILNEMPNIKRIN